MKDIAIKTIMKNILSYPSPSITNITWDNYDHFEDSLYTLFITAHDPQGLDLSYEVTCDNPDVNIVQNDKINSIFKITYPKLSTQTQVVFNIKVTNSRGSSVSTTDIRLVQLSKSPVIDNISIDNAESNSFDIIVNATDYSGSGLNYSVRSDSSNVTITQDTNEKDRFHITYPDFLGKSVILNFFISIEDIHNKSDRVIYYWSNQ